MEHLQKMKDKEKEVSLFENEKPHFFKVFLKDDLLTTRLGIPRKFARKYSGCLSDPVCLTVPTGDCWEVRLEKEDGAIFLREGWAEFVKHYQISYGCFVVFRFEGGSRFQVIIFNVTACEIDYPVKPALTPKLEGVDIGEEVRLFKFSGKKRKRELLLEHFPRRSKIITRGTRAGKASCSLTKRELPIKIGTPDGAKQTRGTFDGQLNSDSLRIHSAAAKAASKSGVLARACSYECKRPSFVIIVGCSSFRPHPYMHLPSGFLKLGILKNEEVGTITLSVSDQKNWTVRYRNARRCTISHGWKEFVLENDLRAGDVLVFELIRIVKVTFRVVIFRNNVASRPRPSSVAAERRKQVTVKPAPKTCSSRRPAIPDVTQENPSFETVISQRDVMTGSHYVPVQSAIALKQASHGMNDMATLKVGKMTWLVELKTHAQGSEALSMGRGWTRFMQANDLRIGDICMFKLVDRENTVLDISIRKKTRLRP